MVIGDRFGGSGDVGLRFRVASANESQSAHPMRARAMRKEACRAEARRYNSRPVDSAGVNIVASVGLAAITGSGSKSRGRRSGCSRHVFFREANCVRRGSDFVAIRNDLGVLFCVTCGDF